MRSPVVPINVRAFGTLLIACAILAGCRPKAEGPTDPPGVSGQSGGVRGDSSSEFRNRSGEPTPRDLAFIYNGETSRLYLLTADSDQPRKLAEGVWVAHPPAWSPDGSSLAFCAEDAEGRREIRVIDRKSGESSSPAESIKPTSGPTWSPDGSRLAFAGKRKDDEGIWVVSPDGAGQQFAPVPDAGRVPWVGWSPGDDGIAFLWMQEEEGVDCDLKLIGSDLKDERVLTSTRPASATARPAWRPGGGAIAYASAEGTEDVYICVIDLPDGKFRELLNVGTSIPDPTWAPDGLHMCIDLPTKMMELGMDDPDEFSKQLADIVASIEVFLITVETGEKKQVTDNTFPESHLDWSSDSRYLASVAVRAGGKTSQIRIIDGEQGTTRSVLEAEVVDPPETAEERLEHGFLLAPRWRP